MQLSRQYNIAILIGGGFSICIAFFITAVILLFELCLQLLDFTGCAAIPESKENRCTNKDKYSQLVADNIAAERFGLSMLNSGRGFFNGFVTVHFLNRIFSVLVMNGERAFQKSLGVGAEALVLLVLPKHDQHARSIWK